MGWKEWPSWVKGGVIGIILYIAFFLLLILFFVRGVQSIDFGSLSLASLIPLVLFILSGMLITSVINKNWHWLMKCVTIVIITIITLFLAAVLLFYLSALTGASLI